MNRRPRGFQEERPGSASNSSVATKTAWGDGREGSDGGSTAAGSTSSSLSELTPWDASQTLVLHPALCRLPEPGFDFKNSVPPEERKVDVAGEEPADAIPILAKWFADKLWFHRQAGRPLPLPDKVPAKLMLSSFCTALFLAGSMHEGMSLAGDGRGEHDEARRPGSAPRRPGSAPGRGQKRRPSSSFTFTCGPDNCEARSRALLFLEAWRGAREIALRHTDEGELSFPAPSRAAAQAFKTELNNGAARMERTVVAMSTLFHAVQITDPARALASGQIKVARLPPMGTSGCRIGAVNVALAGGSPLQAVGNRSRTCGGKVGLVLACSGYVAGGTFLEGRHRGLEEEVCMRSTLFPYLQEACAHGEEFGDPKGIHIYIPDDGALGIGNVQVFRAGYQEAYAPLRDPFIMHALCIFLPNLGHRFSSTSKDVLGPSYAGINRHVYNSSLSRKFENVINLAMQMGLEAIVISDDGVEARHNDPSVFGKALGLVLAGLEIDNLPEIVLAGSSRFVSAVRHCLASVLKNPTRFM